MIEALRVSPIITPRDAQWESAVREAKQIQGRTWQKYPDSRGVYDTQQVTNYAQHQLAVALTNGAGPITATMDSVAGWPTIGNFRLRLDDLPPATTYEIVEVTSVNVGASQVTIGTRGLEGTSAIAHGIGTKVGNPLTAAMLLAMTPLGTMGYAQVVANQGPFTALTDLTSLTQTVTPVSAGRRIQVTGIVRMFSTVANDTWILSIYEGATQLNFADGAFLLANIDVSMRVEVILTPTFAAHTYKLSAQRGAGTGNLTMQASATGPASILVEDIGQ